MELPYWLSVVFPVLGIFLSWALYLSSAFAIREMLKTKVLHVNPYPYPILLLNAVIWGCYGLFVKKDPYIYWANAPGVLLMLQLTMIVFSLSSETTRKYFYGILLGLGGLISVVVFIGQFFLSLEYAVILIGVSANLVTCLTFIFPLVVIFSVIKLQDSSVIDPRLASVQFLNALVWMSYGLVIKSPIIYASNIFGSVMGLLQIILWISFRKSYHRELLPSNISEMTEI